MADIPDPWNRETSRPTILNLGNIDATPGKAKAESKAQTVYEYRI